MTRLIKATIATAVWAAAGVCAAAVNEPDVGRNVTIPEPDIIVIGKSYGELRHEIRLAEEAFYARFNDINSDDRFDIHCRLEARIGSRIQRRFCLSNSWREQDTNFAQATVQQIRGELGANPQQFRAEQLYMQQRLRDEMRRLATVDEELLGAVVRLAGAQQALSQRAGSRPPWTLSREVTAGDDGLPFDAQRVFQVQVRRDPWSHRLTERTFTIAHVDGEIRDLEIACEQGSERIEYEAELEWTLPTGWNACALFVDAKRDTTFALYEFE
jgi:hypothetical protein